MRSSAALSAPGNRGIPGLLWPTVYEQKSAGAGYAPQKGEAIAHDNGYQLIQSYIGFIRGLPGDTISRIAYFRDLAFDLVENPLG
jgi:hypothetical protein